MATEDKFAEENLTDEELDAVSGGSLEDFSIEPFIFIGSGPG